MDKEFKKWFKKQEINFHNEKYSDLQIAYAGYCYAKEELKNYKFKKRKCNCKEGKQGRTVDENFEQICEVCGGY